jgi:hypothetical protein
VSWSWNVDRAGGLKELLHAQFNAMEGDLSNENMELEKDRKNDCDTSRA